MTASTTQCEQCGATVTAGARFCMSCGSDISGQQGEIATQHVATVSPTQQFKRGLLQALRDATLGDYEVLAELGAGGMATVFLAHDIHLDRKVAIKVMNPQLVVGDEMVERFKLEARTAAGLSHPHIIPIYAVKQDDDLLYFVMKFVEGRPLDSIIKQEAPLPIPMVRQIVSRVADALGYAHRKGIVHRDIKPANIMIDTEGMPIVTDFGIAKVADAKGLTMTGATIGTPTYMSPEQCNALPITGASDQYSLGVMAYEMLTGKPLFDGESVMTIMFKHVHEQPAGLRDLHGCPPDLADTLMRMLGKTPEERFPTMEEVVKAVRAETMAFDDPVRTQLVAFAMEGENRTVLQRVSTPRSPIPVGTGAGSTVSTGPRTQRRPGTTTRPSQEPTELLDTAHGRRRRHGVLAVAGVVALAAGGAALAVLQPWAAEDAAAPEELAAVSPPVEPQATGGDPAGDVPAAGQAESGGAEPAARDPAPPVQQVPPAARTPAPVASVRVSGAPGTLGLGESAPLTADVRDAQNQPLSGRAVRWTSNAPDVVSVTSDGQVTGESPGRATLTATAEGASGTATITVSPEAVASVRVTPGQVSLKVGESRSLTARVLGERGGVIDRAVAWSSSDTRIAEVGADGTVRGVGAGTATVTAASEGREASAMVTVAPAPPSEEDLRRQVAAVIQEYARALEAKSVDQVRTLYPGMPPQRERALRDALSTMQGLDVSLTIGRVSITGAEATAVVTGLWTFRSDGQNVELPANNTYRLRREGAGWVITEIQ